MRALLAIAALVSAGGCHSEDVNLRVKVLVPAEIATLSTGMMRLSLWVYDPLLADAPAMLADADSARFSHRQGEETGLLMHVAADVASGLEHYISVEGFDQSGAVETRVLWDGIQGVAAPRTVVMRAVQMPPP